MFIELHRTDGQKVLVFVATIATVDPCDQHALVTFGNNHFIEVRESYDEIKDLIDRVRRQQGR